MLEPGETLDAPIDCLQFVIQRVEEETTSIAVELAGFDLMALFAQAFDEEKVTPAIREQILTRYHAELVHG